jgi:hypothetical protein
MTGTSCRIYKNTGDKQLRTLQKTAIAMAAAQFALASGAYAQAALDSNKDENVVMVSPF